MIKTNLNKITQTMEGKEKMNLKSNLREAKSKWSLEDDEFNEGMVEVFDRGCRLLNRRGC